MDEEIRTLEWLRREWAVIRTTPFSFFVSVAVFAAIIGWVVHYLHKSQIDALQEQVRLQDIRISAIRESIGSKATPARRKESTEASSKEGVQPQSNSPNLVQDGGPDERPPPMADGRYSMLVSVDIPLDIARPTITIENKSDKSIEYVGERLSIKINGAEIVRESFAGGTLKPLSTDTISPKTKFSVDYIKSDTVEVIFSVEIFYGFNGSELSNYLDEWIVCTVDRKRPEHTVCPYRKFSDYVRRS